MNKETIVGPIYTDSMVIQLWSRCPWSIPSIDMTMSNQALREWRSEHTISRAEPRMAAGLSELIFIQQKIIFLSKLRKVNY